MAAAITVPLELHLSRRARERYGIDERLLSQDGHAIFADFHAARLFARKLNARRDLARFPEQSVSAGDLNAMGLIVEILHYVVGLYREQIDPDVMAAAAAALDEQLGPAAIDAVLLHFLEDFPPRPVFRREASAADWLGGRSRGVPHRLVLLEELLMLWLSNVNPAFGPFLDLFDDAQLERATVYRDIFPVLRAWFAAKPPFGPDAQNLIDMLRAPALAAPHSLNGQLEYIRERWGRLLGDRLWRLLSGLDLLREEGRWRAFGAGGRGPAEVLRFGTTAPYDTDDERQRYSPDRDWMPRVVLLAKSTYVWLDQLSRQYGRHIQRLDQVPEEELARLASWGFTALWLIGVWQRSRASAHIKRRCGNPEAVASAYSLDDYRIADDLGGEDAFLRLRDQAWRHGIRLAGDMVPNHVGIDGRWVIEHPEWFIGVDHPPFPGYSFNGPDLSEDPRVGLFIEDHYYDRSDAAVVFKRVDRGSGATRYIYHGNDGTGMPWNDTAQLDYLNADVREAVTRTIIHTARLFPIIRFDAAMTLAKRHYQRLWFPAPGCGGDIPSRAGQGLTREQFDAAMPVEFWREVVDRCAADAPDTLLLAEAFWLMEGYFVRTLGMHRVYNSSFMNMLKMEENAKYRQTLRNVLEYDPEILKRFVNFMNNPDEETAVAQFGKGDKYFGVCLMLATLPGLPMFGHGQIEGLTEKYGMEYRRAYWNEELDPELVRRHEREIFPLLHRRGLFAGVEHFQLFDLFEASGAVNEDVFAYANGEGRERALVIYHNRFRTAAGWLRVAAARLERQEDGAWRLARRSLGEALALAPAAGTFAVFRDAVTQLEYIRATEDICERGLFVELGAYARHAFLDFRVVTASRAEPYGDLSAFLNGRGVPSIADALRQMFLQPVLTPLRALLAADLLSGLFDDFTDATAARRSATLDSAHIALLELCRRARDLAGAPVIGAPPEEVAARARLCLATLMERPGLPRLALPATVPAVRPAAQAGGKTTGEAPDTATPKTLPVADARLPLVLWAFLQGIGRLADADDVGELSRSWLDDWLLAKVVTAALRGLGLSEEAAWQTTGTVRALITHGRLLSAATAREALDDLLRDDQVRQLLGVNRWQGVLWFRGEAFEALIDAIEALAALDLAVQAAEGTAPPAAEVARRRALLGALREAGARAGYRVEALLAGE